MLAFVFLQLILASGVGLTLVPLSAILPDRPDMQPCASYHDDTGAIVVECDASLEGVHGDISGGLGDAALVINGSEWILDAVMRVNNGATLTLDTGGSWLKIMDDNGIIVDGGRLNINNSRITSWSDEGRAIDQNSNGSNERAFIQIRQSDGVLITHSEFGYLGYNEPGKRGFDVFGEPSHNIEIKNSKFHHMWMAFYSKEAYDIVVNGSEYYDNVKYALDPHTGTHDMEVTGNHLHHNPIGVICSLDCSNILIEGNRVHDNNDSGIFLSRNMHDSMVRNNDVYGGELGIVVSESPDNEIVGNKIQASERGIVLFNPTDPDDGETEDNVIHNNSISEAEHGIAAVRSQDNVLENNNFSDVRSEYYLTRDSSIIIRNQTFNDHEIRSNRGTNTVEIEDSGIVRIEDDLYESDTDRIRKQLNRDTFTVSSQ